MTLEEFQAQLEDEKSWREEDIRFYNNLQARLNNDNDRFRLRRSIVCMFYAHIEGFVYSSFSLYAESINSLGLKCKEVKPAIAAATLSDEFLALKNPAKKSTLFKRALPDDAKLHRICRETEFIEHSLLLQERIVKIPKKYINTESNVGSDVLRKLLYQMGLNHEDSEIIRSELNQLLVIRNDIAHGKSKEGINNVQYERFKECFYEILSRLSNLIVRSFINKDFMMEI